MSTMVNWRELEERISAAVRLARRPVAVTFRDRGSGERRKNSKAANRLAAVSGGWR